MNLHFIVPLAPVAKARPRFSPNGPYTPEETRRFEQMFILLTKKAHPESPLDGPLSVTMDFFVTRPKTTKRKHPTTRPDLDNYVKAVLDSGNELFWSDDAQVIEILARKHYASEGGEPRIEILIEEVTE